MPPLRWAAKSSNSRISSSTQTSVCLKLMRPSCCRDKASPPAASMSAATTQAPSEARRSAVALPMPEAAPVTTAVLPSNLIGRLR